MQLVWISEESLFSVLWRESRIYGGGRKSLLGTSQIIKAVVDESRVFYYCGWFVSAVLGVSLL